MHSIRRPIVSPQHGVLVRSKIAQRMFGAIEVLAAAKQLLHLDGIEVAGDLAEVEYFHILFDRHEIVVSNCAEIESLYTGKESLKAVGPAARAEISALFPELREMDGEQPCVRRLSTAKQARKLAAHHARHGHPLVCWRLDLPMVRAGLPKAVIDGIFLEASMSPEPTEVRMGKRALDFWTARVHSRRTMFEIYGVDNDIAREALRLGAQKLPVRTRIVRRNQIDASPQTARFFVSCRS